MNTEYGFEDDKMEKIITKLKSDLFDIVAENEARISEMEEVFANEVDEAKREELQNLYIQYNSVLRSTINSANILSQSLKGLDRFSSEYHKMFSVNAMDLTSKEFADSSANEREKDPVVVSSELPSVKIPEEIVEVVPEEAVVSVELPSVEAPKEDVVEAVPTEAKEVDAVAPAEVAGVEVPEEDAVEAVPTEAKEVDAVAPAEVAGVEVPKEDAVEAVPTEAKEAEAVVPAEVASVEVPKEEVVKPVPVDAKAEAVAPAEVASVEVPKEDAVEAVPTEAKEVDAVAPAEVASVEVPKEDAVEAVPTEAKEVDAVAPAEVASVEVSKEEVVKPVLEEAKEEVTIPVELPTVDLKQGVVSEPKDGVIQEPLLPSIDVSASSTNTESSSLKGKKILNGYPGDGKAILITTAQGANLRKSKKTQEILFDATSNSQSSIQEDVTTQEQLEEMLGQVTTLYGEGKTDEAEALSEKVSVLSKQLKQGIQPAA